MHLVEILTLKKSLKILWVIQCTQTHKVAIRLWLLLGVLTDMTKFHIQYIYFLCSVIAECVCVCVYVRWEYIHTYVVLYIYTRSMHIIEKLPLVLLGITSYPFSNLKQFWGWGRVKDWKSSRFRPSPVCRSRSRSHAVIGPHCVRTLASSQNHSLDTSTQTLAQQHRRPSV